MRNWTAIADQIEEQERKFLDAKKAGNRALEKDMLAVMQAMLSVNRKTIMEALRAAPANPFGDAPVTSYCTHAEADAAIASARPEALRSEWQPIETAPKDGTEILGYRKDADAFLIRWTSAESFCTDEELGALGDSGYVESWWYADFVAGGRLEGSETPTHWMPLPSVPSPRGTK